MKQAKSKGADFPLRLRADLIRALYARSPHAVAGHLLALGAVLVALWDSVDRTVLALWAIGIGLGNLARVTALIRFRRHAEQASDLDLVLFNWTTFFTATAWASGTLISLTYLPPAYQAFLCLVMAGITAGAVVTLSPFLSTFAVFGGTLLLPLSLQLLGQENEVSIHMGVVGLVFLVFCLAGSKEARQTLIDAFGRKYEIERIASDLGQEKQRTEKALERVEISNRIKDEFLANMSHEIRTPMNGVLGTAELLRGAALTPEQRDLVETLHESGKDLLHIVQDILEISNMASERVSLETGSFELVAILQKPIAQYADRARRKGLRFECRLSDELPRVVSSDPARLQQILHKLLDNAVKFTTEGSVTVNVDAKRTTSPQEAELILDIHDTGVGIPADQLSSIFECFTQADGSLTREHGGTGLGLAITAHLLKLMNGRLHVESQPDRGSHFSLSLPITVEHWEDSPSPPTAAEGEASPSTAPTSAQDSPPPVDSPASNSSESRDSVSTVGRDSASEDKSPALHALIVEDNSTNRKLITRVLEKLGHKVTTAEDGVIGVERYQDGEFDVVFMDLQMPHKDGFEATAEIRELQQRRGRRVPILALTAHALVEDRRRCLEAGMDDHLTKPIQLKRIEEALQRWVPTITAS